MKARLMLALVCMVFVGCAQRALVREWKDKRGYTEQEIALITPHHSTYSKTMAASASFGSPFSTAANTAESERRMRAIVCNCLKKFGDSCRRKPDGLKGDDLDLWAKSNAAELALMGTHSDANTLGVSPTVVDVAECQ